MADKELRRLSRADLVEIIYEVRRNEAALQKENEELKAKLEERQLRAEKAGSLAELAAALEGLFEAAQATADDYLDGIREAHERAERLWQDTEQRAAAVTQRTLQERKRMLARTEAECRRMAAGTAAVPEAPGQAPEEEPDGLIRAAMEGRYDE